jgi:fructose-1,6-bisphosphatase/inositol monophosphatase family enzyme
VDDAGALRVLSEAAEAVGRAISGVEDWGPSGQRPGQYKVDLVADDAALDVLHGTGLTVLSEESGLTGPSGPRPRSATGDQVPDELVVVDPIDGSTNAHRRLPFYATSLCLLDGEGPRVALVVDQASGTRYEAVRGSGARRDGQAVAPSGQTQLRDAVVGLSGFPSRWLGWAQFRTLGAASLELCYVADGSLDAFLLMGNARLYGWDYLAGLLICKEAGAGIEDLDDRELVVRDDTRRRPLATATPMLRDQLRAAIPS